jgi:hypothetical protein
MICYTFVSHIVSHHQAIVIIKLDKQWVTKNIWDEMVRLRRVMFIYSAPLIAMYKLYSHIMYY